MSHNKRFQRLCFNTFVVSGWINCDLYFCKAVFYFHLILILDLFEKWNCHTENILWPPHLHSQPAGTATWSITWSCWSPGPSTSAPSRSWCPSATRWAASSRWRRWTSPRPPPSSTTPSWWTRPWVRNCWHRLSSNVHDRAAGGAKGAFCNQSCVFGFEVNSLLLLLQLLSSRTAYQNRTWMRWTLRSFETHCTR